MKSLVYLNYSNECQLTPSEISLSEILLFFLNNNTSLLYNSFHSRRTFRYHTIIHRIAHHEMYTFVRIMQQIIKRANRAGWRCLFRKFCKKKKQNNRRRLSVDAGLIGAVWLYDTEGAYRRLTQFGFLTRRAPIGAAKIISIFIPIHLS